MSTHDDGGPAFPVHGAAIGDDPRNRILAGGMTLRDYFAAAAMQGILACATDDWSTYEERAEFAYKQVDAMLAERAK